MDNKYDVIEENQINGQALISLSVEQLKIELGCTSFEVNKIQASIEFSFEITEGSDKPEKPTCKPPQSWTEAEICLVLVAIGVGEKVEKFQRNQVTGAVIVSATSVELEQECGMTSVEVKKFQAVIVKTEKGGCGIEPDADTMPSQPPQVESDSVKGPNKVAIGASSVAGVAVVGGIGYAAWKKNKDEKDEEAEAVPSPEEDEPEEDELESGENSPVKHPVSWTKVEVRVSFPFLFFSA